jgi:hypothetical protein
MPQKSTRFENGLSSQDFLLVIPITQRNSAHLDAYLILDANLHLNCTAVQRAATEFQVKLAGIVFFAIEFIFTRSVMKCV